MKKILLVDDEQEFLEICKMVLIQNNFEVTLAADGERAKKLLSNENYDLVISDFRMPKVDGLQLFNWVKANKTMPFVLMTGYSDISSTTEANDMGIDGYLSKPFGFEDLTDTIYNILGGDNREISAATSYSKIPIEHFFCGFQIPYNVYIERSKEKFTKVAHSGESLERKKILEYQKKGVQFLYLKEEDFKKYVTFHLSIVRSQAASRKLNKEEIEKLVGGISQDIFNKVYTGDVDQDLFELAKDALCIAATQLVENPSAHAILNRLQADPKDLYYHSLAVSIYSSMVANKLGYDLSEDLFNISIGAFFHDIGKRPLSSEKNREGEMVGGHPEAGYLMLKSLGTIPAEVLNIILSHEDVFGTSKLPRKKGRVASAHIVCVVNKFCNNIERKDGESVDYNGIIRRLVQSEPEINKEVIAALENIFCESKRKKGEKLVS